jgi:hypothetical protein
MKVVISILVILAVGVGAFKLWEYWDRVNQEKETTQKSADGSDISEYRLSGMGSYELEQRYTKAKQNGPAAMKEFLDTYRNAPKFDDPRKAWIELDYAVLITPSDPLEAKKIFLDVKQRIPTNSPIYPRIRAMSKTYE